MEKFDQSEAYLIKVDQERIGKILSILKDNDALDLVKVTILGEVIENCEIEGIIDEVINEKCVSCWFEKKITRDVKTCRICQRAFCKNHSVRCKSCHEYVCDLDTTVSFLFNHSTGEIVCKQCK